MSQLEVEYFRELLERLYQACTTGDWDFEYFSTHIHDDLMQEIEETLGIDCPAKEN